MTLAANKRFLLLLPLFSAALLGSGQPSNPSMAIVGATVIDGNGGAPIPDAAVVMGGRRILAVGPRSSVTIPPDAEVIDATGKYVTPGFIDTNVHLSLYGGHTKSRYETLVRYQHRQDEVILEAAQLQLKYGVTTVRDSYGVLSPLMQVRDRIAGGDAVGARMLVAGNIVGWGGPFSLTFSLIPEEGLTLFQEQMNDLVSQGVGEGLMDMTPEELRLAINEYLNKGPDFIKYGGTSHFSVPTFIGFSPDAQKIIVEETHRRGLVAETHSTTIEGLRLSILAGIDLIQHPEVLDPREMPDDLVQLIRERGVICSILSNTLTGEAWQKHLKDKEEAEQKKATAQEERAQRGQKEERARTSAEMRSEVVELGVLVETRRRNAEKLIRGGCTVTIGTDNYRAAAPEFARAPKPVYQDPGIGSIIAIEGLVELGMSPAEAIVSATKNGALACGALEEYGTLEAGKRADLLILDADPLADIRNIRTVKTVIKDGKIVDRDSLPENPIYYRSVKKEALP